MGHRSVDRPSNVSTALRAELCIGMVGGIGQVLEVDWTLAFGAVPSERAAITS
jgi:hypothetical protein